MAEQRYKLILAFAAVYVIWGSTYLAIRFAVETMPPFIMTGMRFLTGGFVFYVWLRVRGSEKPRKSHWLAAVVLGLLMPAGGTGLVAWAEQTVPSGLAALMVATVPLWVVVFDWLRPKGVRPSTLVVLGLILGFVGVGLLVNPTHIAGLEDIDIVGAAVIMIATVSWAAGSIYSRQARQPSSKMMAVAMQMIAGGVGLVLISMVSGEYRSFEYVAVSLKSWLSLAYLITAGSVAFAAYIWLLSAAGAARAATYAYVNPVIALVLGTALAGETLSLWILGCSLIVVTAVVIIISSRDRAAKEASDIPVEPPRLEQPCPETR